MQMIGGRQGLRLVDCVQTLINPENGLVGFKKVNEFWYVELIKDKIPVRISLYPSPYGIVPALRNFSLISKNEIEITILTMSDQIILYILVEQYWTY